MPTQDTSPVKEKILNFLKLRGPSLPVHIAKEVNMNTLFTSAFLSELLSEREIKISDMKVGSSRLHFLEGQEPKLENFSQHLGRKEKEAFDLLKRKGFLKDSEQEPAIRVALQSIKDFAIPFNTPEGKMWRYFTIKESEFNPPKPKPEPQSEPKPEVKEQIIEKPKEQPPPKIKTKRKSSSKSNQKQHEKFFNKVKDFLNEKQIEITGIEGFAKKDLTLKVKKNDREYLLVAFDKKRVTDKDIIKVHKKSKEKNLRYLILSLGEPLKKVQELIEAAKNLAGMEKIE